MKNARRKAMDNRTLIIYAEEFTERYKNANDKYAREAACLELQFSQALLPMRDGDMLAGRIKELPIGILPQVSCGVGYYIDEERFVAMSADRELSEVERRKAEELLSFWKEENTRAKLIREYPSEWLDIFVHNVPYDTPTSAFGLYRISGIHMDPARLLENGIGGLVELVRSKSESSPQFYAGLEAALFLMRDVCLRYAREAEACGRGDVAENLRAVSWEKPRNMWQAMQLSYLLVTLSGAWNYGRMDKYLGDYLANDLESGVLTEETALELIMNLWSLLEERNNYFDSRVILGGKDRGKGSDEFAMLAMEATRRRKGIVPQLTLRCYSGMDVRLYDKALEVIGEGTTFPMLYNDDVNVPAVANAFDVDLETAQDYVPFGCGEYVLYNKSIGTPSGTLNMLHTLNESVYGSHAEVFRKAETFEEFYQGYLRRIKEIVTCLAAQEKLEYDVCGRECPFLFFSLAFEDCIERGKAVLEGGLRHLGGTVETYGNVNTADSLTAIKQLVFEKKAVSKDELASALIKDFVGYEILRTKLLDEPKYGNDDEEADSVLVKMHSDVCNIIRDSASEAGLDSYLAVVINNELNTTFGEATGASADGRHANTYMANANNPTGGMDKNGITAMLNSLVKPDISVHAGAVQNMRFSREMFGSMLPKLKGLLRAYFENGGAQTMITVLSRGDLEAALVEPEKYQSLVVRVGGFSARFIDLQKSVQRELISRTLY